MYTRVRCGKGFSYRDAQGQTVRDAKVRTWIDSLVIPPAWTDVQISEDRDADLLATGRDSKGRKQYRYHTRFRQQQDQAKFDRMIQFAERLDAMREQTAKHLRKRGLCKDKILACMVRLIDSAYFRAGNVRYTKQNHSYGLTTLRRRHLSVDGDELVFSYRGKSGKDQERHVIDRRLSQIVSALSELSGYRLFKYLDEQGERHEIDSHDLNDYIRQIMGEDFSAKDFRTWGGTVMAALTLAEQGWCNDAKDQERCIKHAVEKTAERLGNTPTVARGSYIDPRVLLHFQQGRSVADMGRAMKRLQAKYQYLSDDELRVLCLLRAKVKDDRAIAA